MREIALHVLATLATRACGSGDDYVIRKLQPIETCPSCRRGSNPVRGRSSPIFGERGTSRTGALRLLQGCCNGGSGEEFAPCEPIEITGGPERTALLRYNQELTLTNRSSGRLWAAMDISHADKPRRSAFETDR
jgi:hypothetical protein